MKENILKTMRKNYMYGIAIILLVALIIMGILYYKQKSKYAIASENNYNLALYELVDYINDTENYLAKSTITGSSEQASETLMHIWREANLAQVYLAQLPISTNELSNTARFLNQVSDYSHSLAKKTINGEDLSQEELDNLKKLHQYSQNLQNTLEQLTYMNDVMFINVNDADITGSKGFNIDSNKYIPELIFKDKKLQEYELKMKKQMYENAERKLKKYGISMVSIESNSEVPLKIINLLERHRNANIR